MRISRTNSPVVVITMGDPAGIGPEIIAKSMASPDIRGLAIFVIVADAGIMEKALGVAGAGALKVHGPALKGDDIPLTENKINIIDPSPVTPVPAADKPTDAGARKALECVRFAAELLRRGADAPLAAMVTAPVDKSRIARICPGFIGHTEYLRDQVSSPGVTMVMIGKSLIVVPVTRHIPVRDIAGALSAGLITDTLDRIVRHRRLISAKDDPVIGVAALNPHCGEGGTIGSEEKDFISPAVEKAKGSYSGIIGPISADTIFCKAVKKEIDIVVGMYHDQCLAPFKMLDFDTGVNMTLGLGFVRTSPDHGTAFDIAAEWKASSASMENAIHLAVRAIGSDWRSEVRR